MIIFQCSPGLENSLDCVNVYDSNIDVGRWWLLWNYLTNNTKYKYSQEIYENYQVNNAIYRRYLHEQKDTFMINEILNMKIIKNVTKYPDVIGILYEVDQKPINILEFPNTDGCNKSLDTFKSDHIFSLIGSPKHEFILTKELNQSNDTHDFYNIKVIMDDENEMDNIYPILQKNIGVL